MKKIYFLCFILLSSLFHSFAQNGNIKGKVFDKKTGETLIGATVVVKSTANNLGTVTDFDGNFFIGNVPAGKQTLLVKFMSYQPVKLENVNVEAGKITELNIEMSKSDQQLEQVVVTANKIRNTENSVLVQQKKSVSLLNGISSEKMSKLGADNAASALQKVTGVSVQGGKYIFVRGLSDRYSKIVLNDAEIPGLDPNKNTVQLDLFSTNIIDNIIVHKTYSPELSGSFAGGYVNIITKSFPNKMSVNASVSVGYNSMTNLKSDFLTYTGGKYDFLGIDDGTRAIPAAANQHIPYLFENNDKLDAVTSSFNKIWLPFEGSSGLNQAYSFSFSNIKQINGKSIGVILDLSYSNKYQSYNNAEYARYNLVEDVEKQGVMNPVVLENEQYGQQEVLNSALFGIAYKINSRNKISLTLLRNGSGTSYARHREGSKPEDNLYMLENTIGYQQRSFISAQLGGTNVIGKNKTKIKWNTSLTKSRLYEPDLRFFNYDSTTQGTYQISYSMYPAPSRFYRNLNELNADNKIFITVPFDRFNLKFGGSFTYKNRTNISHKFDMLTQGLQFNGDIDEYLSDANIGQNADATYGIYYQNDPITDKYNSYFATEYLAGAYTMLEFSLLKSVDIQVGVRYEYDYTYIRNMVEIYHPKFVQAQKLYPYDILPAMNMVYHIAKSSNIRFALSRTLGRPAFREIAPYAYYDFKQGWRVVGNPQLERTTINNFDLRWEKFMPKAQLMSASIFVKQFDKPIELVDDPRANNPELHYVNADNSVLYGVELELRKNFDFLNLPDLNLGGNFTYLVSQVKYVENFGNQQNEDFVVHRPMYGQSPWVVNTYLSYANKKYGIAGNISLNIAGPKLAVVTKGNTPDIYEQPVPEVNLNISKKITDRIYLHLSVDNLLDAKHRKIYTYNDEEFNYQSYQLGHTITFTIKYRIK